MNSISSRGFPLKGLGIHHTAFGTEMYLLEWGSSLPLSDMMESTAFRIRTYLVKDGREKDYSSELTAPPSLQDTGTRPVT
jgi:hypothetical protein